MLNPTTHLFHAITKNKSQNISLICNPSDVA